jgi:hypothetical protein
MSACACETITISGTELRKGSRVRLRPRGPGRHLLDSHLSGKAGTVDSIEQDCDGGIHVAVSVDGVDRMYFDPAEIEIT